MSSAYFAPLVTAPIVITDPGQYVTRGGEVVMVNKVSQKNDFGCRGQYQNGVRERWHRSGRIFAGQESMNDIVRRA
jgi:hypothetical protein